MKLYVTRLNKHVEFGHVASAAFILGFFGRWLWFHYVLACLGMTFKNTTFKAKTITWKPIEGNIPLRPNGEPRWPFTRCIIVSWLRDYVFNVVGLSNLGAEATLAQGEWQKRTEPFIISFMVTGTTREERLQKIRDFTALLGRELPHFHAPIALEFNYACPNEGPYRDMGPEALANEMTEHLEIAVELDIPRFVNCNAFMPIEVLRAVASHCEGFCIGNTVPGGYPNFPWKFIMGKDHFPLEHRKLKVSGKGGYSGPYALSRTEAKVREMREAGITLPIWAGNGIRSEEDVMYLQMAGANAIFIGSVALTRPWRMRSIIRAAEELWGEKTSDEPDSQPQLGNK